MISFKQYLSEDNTTQQKHYPWQALTNEDLLKLPNWSKYNSERYDEPGGDVVVCYDEHTGEMFMSGRMVNGFFEPDDTVYFDDKILVEYNGQHYFPVRFKILKDQNVNLRMPKLSSLVGLPSIIPGHFTIEDCDNIKSVEGCPSVVDGNFTWQEMPITNRISDVISEVLGNVLVPDTYKGLLSLLKIKKRKSISTYRWDNEDLEKAIDIVNAYITESSNNIIQCQEELMDENLGEYAKF